MSDDECYMPGVVGRQIENEIERAKDGDTEATRRLLERFCGAIKANTDKDGKPYRKPSGTGTRIDERILRYLAECFQKILDGGPGARQNADHALNLATHRRGNKKNPFRRKKTLDIGYKVYSRREEIEAASGQAPLDTAINEVAKECHASYQTVKNAYDDWRKLLQPLSEKG